MNSKKEYLALIDEILSKYQDHILFLFIIGYLLGFFTGVVVALYTLYIILDKVVYWINQIKGGGYGFK